MIVRAEECIDVSNYTRLLTPEQQGAVAVNKKGAIIGIQDPVLAREFADQFRTLGLWRAYYVDLRSRDLSVPEPGSFCAIDIESGCFTDQGEILAEVQDELAAGLQVMVYGNETSMRPVIGNSVALAQYPLMWANYGAADPSRFVPFNGWALPTIMQYAGSAGWMGINCDLDLLFYYDGGTLVWTPPPAPPVVKVHQLDIYSDGSYLAPI